MLWVFQCYCEFIRGADMTIVMLTALQREDASIRGVAEGSRPCSDICLIALGVDLGLLAKVGVE